MDPIHPALASFGGALIGTLVALFFARTRALNEALGKQWAEHRIELIERLALVLGEALSLMDESEGVPVYSAPREDGVVFSELTALERRADLYLSAELVKAIHLFSAWLHSEIDTGGVARNSAPMPGSEAIGSVRRMLGEAIEGKHQRVPWYRRWP